MQPSTRWLTFCIGNRRARWSAYLTLSVAILFYLSLRQRRSKEEYQPKPAFAGPRDARLDAGEHGFLQLSDAQDYCQRRRWDIYSTRDQRRKIYDMFLINTELDWLEIRLHELDEAVDFFVILESSSTFQQTPKPLHLQENLASKSLLLTLFVQGRCSRVRDRARTLSTSKISWKKPFLQQSCL